LKEHVTMVKRAPVLIAIALFTWFAGSALAERAFLVTGLDEKVTFDVAGRPVFLAPGRDFVSVIDIGTDPAMPRIAASLPLMNSIFGPPVNLQVTPDQSLALVANAMQWVKERDGWKPAPGNELYVIDLRSDPPRLLDTLRIGAQPSGLSINRRGDLALVANRADKSVSVLAIAGTAVRLVGSVPMDDEVAAVAITPDGRRALALKNAANKVAVLDIDGQRVTYDKSSDMPVGQFPYNIDITPDGRLALVAHTGNGGRPDGHADAVAVIDLTQSTPRVVDYVGVGDAPEAFAISPTGEFAVAVLLGGSILPRDHWAYRRTGSLVILRIDGMRVTKVQEIEVGALPEGVAFTADGRYMYTTDLLDRTLRVFRVEGTTFTDLGVRLPLPGQPGSLRASPN